MKTRSLFLVLTCSLFIITSCNEMPAAPETDNPVDPNNPAYQPPLATLINGPSEGETISSDNVSFSWSGEEAASSFTYFLDGHDSQWSSWDSTTLVSYTGLRDEQSYSFQLREKYVTGDEQTTPTTRNFTVDYADPQAVITSGPADGSTIATAAASFSWSGQGYLSSFSFILEGKDADWSAWNVAMATSYTRLFDGSSYTFKVREKYQTGDEQATPTTRTFTVNYTDPLAVITSGPEDGTTITEAIASFLWVGQGSSSEFSFTLDGFDTDWSNWSTETTASYTDLDDQSYTFKVIERYSNGDEQQSVTTRTFQVDAVTGPALVMHRRFVGTKIGLRFQVEVLVEDITGMMGANINIAFDPSLLQFESATESAFLATGQHSGTMFIASAPDSTNARGSLEIIATRLGGDPVGVTGSGRLALLEFTALSTGESQIAFEIAECQVRNEANQDIVMNDIVHCRVVVTE